MKLNSLKFKSSYFKCIIIAHAIIEVYIKKNHVIDRFFGSENIMKIVLIQKKIEQISHPTI